jgi:hypothetical protein
MEGRMRDARLSRTSLMAHHPRVLSDRLWSDPLLGAQQVPEGQAVQPAAPQHPTT